MVVPSTTHPGGMNTDFSLLNESILPLPPPPETAPSKPKKGAIPRREATEWEIKAIKCLIQPTYTPASFDKRFAREIQGTQQITEGQAAQVWRCFKRYRRQITHPEKDAMLAMAESLAAPELRSK